MAFRSTGYLRSMANRLRGTSTYATSTQPKMKSYAPTADQFGETHQERHAKKAIKGDFAKKAMKGDFVPVCVAVGMIVLSVSLGLYTAKQQIFYSPNVRVKKKTRETIPEVEEPEKVADDAEKFMKKSFFRKVAHVQEFDNQHIMPDPIRKDAFAHQHPRVETLKDVGIDPKQL